MDCGSEGTYVMVEMPQYQVMLDALKTLITAATINDEIYQTVLAAARKAGIS